MKNGGVPRIQRSWDRIRLVAGFTRKSGMASCGVFFFDLLSRIPIIATPLLWKSIIDNFLGARDPTRMAVATGLYALSGAALFVFGTAAALLSAIAAERASRILRTRLFESLDTRHLESVAHDDSGAILSAFANDLPGAEGMLGGAVLSVLVSLSDCLLIVCIIGWLHSPFLLVCLGLSPFLLAILIATNRRIHRASHRLQETQGRVMTALSDLVEGRQDLMALGGLDRTFRDRFQSVYAERFQSLLRMNLSSAAARGLVHFTFWSSAVAILFLGFAKVLDGSITVGTAVAVTELFLGLAFEGRNLYQSNHAIQIGLASLDRIQKRASEWGDAEVEGRADGAIDFAGFSSAAPPAAPAVVRPRLHRDPAAAGNGDILRLDNVCFQYPGGKEVLAGIDLSLRKGFLAIVGPSGSGKTTLAMVASGGFRPTAGAVRYWGRPAEAWDRESLRARIGLMRQSPHVFSCSIRENLRLASPDADEEAMVEALERAALGELLSGLKDGLDTELGDRGQRLSEGQRQRFALARLYLRDAELWILDEPTASLDRDTERRVLAGLLRRAEGRAVLAMTHSREAIQAADQVFEIRDGRLLALSPEDVASAEGLDQYNAPGAVQRART